jgi:hypothetical protein
MGSKDPGLGAHSSSDGHNTKRLKADNGQQVRLPEIIIPCKLSPCY